MALPFGTHVPFGTNASSNPLGFGFGSSLGVPQHHRPPLPDSSAPTTTSFGQPFNPLTAIPPQPYVPESIPSSSNNRQQQQPPQSSPSKKRRQEFDEHEADAAMEGGRSPSPLSSERPKRGLPGKRLRLHDQNQRGGSVTPSEGKPEDDESVDVGSLLASLPSSSLLPILTSLITEKPELKSIVIGLLPRPTLDTAVQAVNNAAKKLREAYPYSLPSQYSHHAATSYGFGVAPTHPTHGTTTSMRDSYIRTRLRQPVREFTKLAVSYITYFSSSSSNHTTSSDPASQQQRPPAVPLHPAETFTFLHNLTLHLLRLPPLTVAELTRPSENVMFPRLVNEWQAWVQKIDDDVNRWGGMYRDEVVRGWDRGLEELVALEEEQASAQGTLLDMKVIRDRWVQRVGWLIGRRVVNFSMDEGV